MTSQTFFFVFIPFLCFILLAVNLIFASHNPYQEKDSIFECGFHSFLGQNRTQFSISFFIFALLFLLFDLEILLVYPYIVSAYSNSIYGLIIMLIFFLVLTLGFAYELGKNALKIDSRQMFTVDKSTNKVAGTSGIITFKGLVKLFFFLTLSWSVRTLLIYSLDLEIKYYLDFLLCTVPSALAILCVEYLGRINIMFTMGGENTSGNVTGMGTSACTSSGSTTGNVTGMGTSAGTSSGSTTGSPRKAINLVELLDPVLPDMRIFGKPRIFTGLFYKTAHGNYMMFYTNTYHDAPVTLFEKIDGIPRGKPSHFIVKIEPPVRISEYVKELYVKRLDTFEKFDPTSKDHIGKEFFVKDKNGSFTVAYSGQIPPITSPKGSPPMEITRHI